MLHAPHVGVSTQAGTIWLPTKYAGTLIENASDFAMYLLEEAHVATVTGDAFGCPNNIRISYAASLEEIEEAIRRIKVALS